MTTDQDRQVLLRLARDVMVAYAHGSPAPRLPAIPALGRPSGVFVSLHKHGELRGCIGHIEADEALVQVVAQCARAVCSTDPRFPPVTEAELADISIQLSVLEPPIAVRSLDEIEIGRDGLLVEMGHHRGLLLPQVATQERWNRRTFVEHACRKAGLRPDDWQRGAELWRFEAEVFAEECRSG